MATCLLVYVAVVLALVHHSENLSIKYHDQKCCIKIAISGQHWTGKPVEKCKKFPLLGNWYKISISVLSFNAESAV